MAWTITSDDVIAVLGPDYDAGSVPDGRAARDLTPFIKAATSTTNQLVLNASKKGLLSSPLKGTLTDDDLEVIGSWLAAHYYQMSDPAYTSRSTQGASGSFAGQLTTGLDMTRYGQMAMRLDWTGFLYRLDKHAYASVTWVG